MPATTFNKQGSAVKHKAYPNSGDCEIEACQSRQFLEFIFKLIDCFHFDVYSRHTLETAGLELWYVLRGEAAEKKSVCHGSYGLDPV